MSKAIIIIVFAFACFLPSAAALAADNTISSNDQLHAAALAADNVISSIDLIDNASEYDGQTVVYTGEVIGDIMPRGEYTWLNVSDGSNAIGAWVKSGYVQDIKIAGRYDAHGDTVKITGVFHRACAEHGGDFDIHAEIVELVEKGYIIDHPVKPIKVILAVTLFIAASGFMAVIWKKKRYHRIEHL